MGDDDVVLMVDDVCGTGVGGEGYTILVLVTAVQLPSLWTVDPYYWYW